MGLVLPKYDEENFYYLYRCTVHFVVYLSNTPTNAFVGVLLK